MRYAAFLRGVSPMNLKMPDLKRCLEAAGFTSVKTLLSSGNAVFDASTTSEGAVAKTIARAMTAELGKVFTPFVRTIPALEALIEEDPFASFELRATDKRIVTFLHEAPVAPPRLPVELEEARILGLRGREALSAYSPGPNGPVFMTLLERTFGKDVTTRTWDTVRKAAKA